jgi:hypothetical protein
MGIQSIIVFAIIMAAALYTGVIIARRTRSFSKKKGCAADCGCEGRSKKVVTRS